MWGVSNPTPVLFKNQLYIERIVNYYSNFHNINNWHIQMYYVQNRNMMKTSSTLVFAASRSFLLLSPPQIETHLAIFLLSYSHSYTVLRYVLPNQCPVSFLPSKLFLSISIKQSWKQSTTSLIYSQNCSFFTSGINRSLTFFVIHDPPTIYQN